MPRTLGTLLRPLALIAAALVTLALAFTAYLIAGSIGLLSAAAELLVELVAAVVASCGRSGMPRARRMRCMPTATPQGGYFSEWRARGRALIVLAAVGIVYTAVQHLAPAARAGGGGAGPADRGCGRRRGASMAGWALVLLRAGRRVQAASALQADAGVAC